MVDITIIAEEVTLPTCRFGFLGKNVNAYGVTVIIPEFKWIMRDSFAVGDRGDINFTYGDPFVGVAISLTDSSVKRVANVYQKIREEDETYTVTCGCYSMEVVKEWDYLHNRIMFQLSLRKSGESKKFLKFKCKSRPVLFETRSGEVYLIVEHRYNHINEIQVINVETKVVYSSCDVYGVGCQIEENDEYFILKTRECLENGYTYRIEKDDPVIIRIDSIATEMGIGLTSSVLFNNDEVFAHSSEYETLGTIVYRKDGVVVNIPIVHIDHPDYEITTGYDPVLMLKGRFLIVIFPFNMFAIIDLNLIDAELVGKTSN